MMMMKINNSIKHHKKGSALWSVSACHWFPAQQGFEVGMNYGMSRRLLCSILSYWDLVKLGINDWKACCETRTIGLCVDLAWQQDGMAHHLSLKQTAVPDGGLKAWSQNGRGCADMD